jgi:uncharacterized membrane protein YhfC
MNMLYIIYPLSGLIAVAIPIIVSIYLVRKYRLEWRFLWLGLIAFVVVTVLSTGYQLLVDKFFNTYVLAELSYSGQILFVALSQGLSIGVIVELSRYALLHWWGKEDTRNVAGLLFGAGYGGVALVNVGLKIILIFVTAVSAIGVSDLTTIGVPLEEVETYQQQFQAYWSQPMHEPFVLVLEFFLLFAIQLALSLLVMQAVTRKQIRWLWIAMGVDALITGLLNYLGKISSQNILLILVTLLAMLGMTLIYRVLKSEGANQAT